MTPGVQSGSMATLGILLAIVVGWFFVENFVLEKYFRYIFTIYPVFILAFIGLVTRLTEGGSRDNLILASVNLSISGNMMLLRILLSIKKFIQLRRQEERTVVVTT